MGRVMALFIYVFLGTLKKASKTLKNSYSTPAVLTTVAALQLT